jgi:putative transposase
MPSTFTSLDYHLVFSTKDRRPSIETNWRAKLHEYLGGTVNGLGGTAKGVGGTADHVHLPVGLRPTHTLSDFMRELKKATSVWVDEEIKVRSFAWQEGYGAFSVSPTARSKVRAYIANQEEHHRTKSFREEFVEFLQQAEILFEDKYLD